MTPTPIRYVADPEAVRRFYLTLGLETGYASPPTRTGVTMWTELRGGEGTLALHHASPGEDAPPLGLSFSSDGEPLEAVAARLRDAGYEPSGIVDETFGRSFTVRDPEGLMIQVNQHDT